jgi:ribonuclease J
LAHQLGIDKGDIAVVENGYPLTFDEVGMHIGQRVPGDHVFVDGALVGEVGPVVMRQREELAEGGYVTAVASYDRQAGKIKGQPRILTQGFVYTPEAQDMLTRAKEIINGNGSIPRGTPPEAVEEQLERALSNFLYRETRRRPVVTVALVEV